LLLSLAAPLLLPVPDTETVIDTNTRLATNIAVAKTITSLIEFDAFEIHAGMQDSLSVLGSSLLVALRAIGGGTVRGVIGNLGAIDKELIPTDEAESDGRITFLRGPTVAVANVLSSA
jgi:hypothetical protein